jgi:hypothetical protein
MAQPSAMLLFAYVVLFLNNHVRYLCTMLPFRSCLSVPTTALLAVDTEAAKLPLRSVCKRSTIGDFSRVSDLRRKLPLPVRSRPMDDGTTPNF